MKKQLINIEPIREQIKEALIDKFNRTTFSSAEAIDVRVSINEIINNYLTEDIKEPVVFITPEAHVKMRALVDKTTTEIGWYGVVDKVDNPNNDIYLIKDIIVYPQTVTGVTCTQDDDSMFEFEMSLTDEQVNHKRFHGHSHVNMGTTASGVDEQFYDDILTQVQDFYITTITNKRGDYNTRFYDVANNILYTDVPINILGINTWYTTEIEKNIKEHKPVTTTTPSIFKDTDSKKDYKYYDDYYYDDWWTSRSKHKKGKR